MEFVDLALQPASFATPLRSFSCPNSTRPAAGEIERLALPRSHAYGAPGRGGIV
jgi:hypothetical protein